jgi:uncharacterized protein YicC (UPF0701 family)
VPVTAKLSQRFYERLGDEIATELVDWFNSVDATYRSDLRELNNTNFARFDATLEQRISAVEAKLEQRISAVETKLEQRISAVEAKLDRRIDALESRMATFEARTEAQIAGIRRDITEQLSAFESRLMRWTIGLWTGTMLTFIGLMIAVLRK